MIQDLNNIFWKHAFSSQLGKGLLGAACIMVKKLKELSGMQSQSLSKIKHHLAMLYTLQNSRLEVMEIIFKAIIGLKIVLTP